MQALHTCDPGDPLCATSNLLAFDVARLESHDEKSVQPCGLVGGLF